MLTYGSICSGIEAASVAWEPLGWRAAFLSEIEPFPRAVLHHHYPAVPLRGDFTEINAGNHDAINLLVGGTPCQSFSVAGFRQGMADARGNLALEYLRLADRLRPTWLVWENVPGVLSSNGGRDFGAFLGGLAELGYGWAYRVLDAQHFGVPQRRRRVFVVGCAGDWRRAAAVLFEPHSMQGHPAPRREAGQAAASPLAAGVAGGSGYRNDADTAENLVSMCLTSHPGRYDAESQTLIAGTLCNSGKAAGSATQQDAEQGMLITHTLRGEGFDASEDGTGRGTPLVPISFDLQQIISAANRTRVEPGLPSSTLAAGSAMHTAGATGVRRLTPRECERLQGFPDDHTLVPYRGKLAADGPRYRALGNSMAVPVMRWIGQRIAAQHNPGKAAP